MPIKAQTKNLSPTNRMSTIVAIAALSAFFPTLVLSATVESRVSASTDDAEERYTGSVGRSSSDLELVFDRGGNQTIGMRFNGLNIPQGAVVTYATIQFTSDENSSVATNLIIQGEASNNATTFTNSAFGISTRPRTTSSVAWSPPPWLIVGQSGPDQRTPDLTALVQEIVNRNGWVSGNSMVMVITGNGERIAESFNGVPSAAPLLQIEYEGGSPSNQAPVTVAGADVSITLPSNTVALDGTVSDDGLPDDTLITFWSHTGGSGAGLVTFTDPEEVDTDVSFSPDPGTYVLKLEASDGQLSSFDEVTVTVDSEGASSLDIRVSASSDDAEEGTSGGVNRTSSDLELVFDRGGNQTIGIRFNGLTIPQGSVVTNATIQFTTDETSTVATDLIFQGEAVDNAASFTNSTFGISTRPRTTSSVAWSPPAWQTTGQAGPNQRTPNLAALVQEIVNRNGWVSGNSLVLLVSGTGERVAESFNGVPSAAPLLHVDFVAGSGGNQAPVTDAGFGTNIILPSNSAALDGTVSDDGLPSGTLTTSWSHIGGTGAGVATFVDPGSIDTTVSFTQDPGTYVLRLEASDGQLSSFDDVTVTVSVPGNVAAISQVNVFLTGFDNGGTPLTIPSIDPAGVLYHGPSGRLFIADSEINEVSQAFNIVQANIFQTSTNGDTLFADWDVTQQTGNEPVSNREPTGITYCDNDAHFYMTNDDADRIFRYSYNGTSFTAVDAISTRPASRDPEGITCDPSTGTLYVIEGTDTEIVVYTYNSGFHLQEVLDLNVTAGTSSGIPTDPEGIAFDPISGHLFIVSDPDRVIYEYTTTGVYVNQFSISGFNPRPRAAQGLSVGTSSLNPQALSLYIADGGVDNDQDPDERDGKIYEAEIIRGQ